MTSKKHSLHPTSKSCEIKSIPEWNKGKASLFSILLYNVCSWSQCCCKQWKKKILIRNIYCKWKEVASGLQRSFFNRMDDRSSTYRGTGWKVISSWALQTHREKEKEYKRKEHNKRDQKCSKRLNQGEKICVFSSEISIFISGKKELSHWQRTKPTPCTQQDNKLRVISESTWLKLPKLR